MSPTELPHSPTEVATPAISHPPSPSPLLQHCPATRRFWFWEALHQPSPTERRCSNTSKFSTFQASLGPAQHQLCLWATFQGNGRIPSAFSSCPSAAGSLSLTGRPQRRWEKLWISEPPLLVAAAHASLPEELFVLPDVCLTCFLTLPSPGESLKQEQGPVLAAIDILKGRNNNGRTEEALSTASGQ